MLKKITLLLCLCLNTFILMGSIPENITRTRQPFMLDLLAKQRGKWHFDCTIGGRISHPNNVAISSREKINSNISKIGILIDNSEFPNDNSKATWKTIAINDNGNFVIEDSGFSMQLKPSYTVGEQFSGKLSKIKLNGAVNISGALAGIYAYDNNKWVALFPEKANAPYIESSKIAGIFTANEPINLFVNAPAGEAELVIKDAYKKATVMNKKIAFNGKEKSIDLDIKNFGCFDIKLSTKDGKSANYRIAKIVEPLEIAPKDSSMGMNIFQQQLWYHTYQLPLFAKAGMRWIRPWLHWENTWKFQEPKAGEFRTQELDTLLRRLEKYNQKLTYILYNFSPKLGLQSTEKSPLNEQQMKEWLVYVQKIVAHCGDKVNDYEVWNEPDLLNAKTPSFDAKFYANLVRQTAVAIRKANPNALVQTMSHAQLIPWLEEFCKQEDVQKSTDVVTLHTYATPFDFASKEYSRMNVLDRANFLKQPRYFNEIGHSGYDESKSYLKAFPIATERNQADSVAINYAQSLYFGNGDGKVFWFCSLDARDSSNPKQHTNDSAYGMLYLGGKPKIAFATLAATAKMLDGRKVLGRLLRLNDIIIVPFSGNRAVLYSRNPKKKCTGVQLGCNANEYLKVYDLFGNLISSGKADTLVLDFSSGPLFLDGCETLAKVANKEFEQWKKQRIVLAQTERQIPQSYPITMKKSDTTKIEFDIPTGAVSSVTYSKNKPFDAIQKSNKNKVVYIINSKNQSGKGSINFDIKIGKNLPVVRRAFPISVGRSEFLADGNFDNLTTAEFYDLTAHGEMDFLDGAQNKGCLKLNAPLANRYHVKTRKQYDPNLPFEFKISLKGKYSGKIAFNIAFFNQQKWLGTWSPIVLGENNIASIDMRDKTVIIPKLDSKWQDFSAKLPKNQIKCSEKISAVLFVDCKGGKQGEFVKIDDIELYQNQEDALCTIQ